MMVVKGKAPFDISARDGVRRQRSSLGEWGKMSLTLIGSSLQEMPDDNDLGLGSFPKSLLPPPFQETLTKHAWVRPNPNAGIIQNRTLLPMGKGVGDRHLRQCKAE